MRNIKDDERKYTDRMEYEDSKKNIYYIFIY